MAGDDPAEAEPQRLAIDAGARPRGRAPVRVARHDQEEAKGDNMDPYGYYYDNLDADEPDVEAEESRETEYVGKHRTADS